MKPEQLEELRDLKKQETRLYVWIRQSIKKNLNTANRAAMIEQRAGLLERMKPLRDQLFSEIRSAGGGLAAEYAREYYGGMSAYEIADLFGYRSGESITAKIKEAERQVAEP